MRAFVLSGAGNRGPLEVGALQALVERGIAPDLLVGTSAGALNAGYVAAYGLSAATIATLGDLWRSVNTDVVYPGGLPGVAWRVVKKEESLFSSDGMRRTLMAGMPPDAKTFADLKLPLYVTATDLLSSRLFVFGDDKTAPLIDAVMASASVPAIHPPVAYEGLQLVDGGVLANVPVSIALEKGATEIYLINAGYGGGKLQPADGVLEVLVRSLHTMLGQSLLENLARARADTSVDLHHLHIQAFDGISFRDFSQTDAMIETGYRLASAYLAKPAPMAPRPLGAPMPSPHGSRVGAAQEYVPEFMR